MITAEVVPQNGQMALQQPQKDPLADASPEWRQTLREAEKLAVATLTPKHLKVEMPPARDGNDAARRAAWNQTVANCILVANQAQKWGADVFAVAAESYVVGNKLGYQGKLIAAVVNARGGLTVPLKAMYSGGKGDDFAAVIYGKRDGDIPEEAWELLEKYVDDQDQKANRKLARLGVLTVRVSVGQCKTDNKMWKNDPEQKLWYTGATKWARRHAPELMVGILSDDDLDRMRAEQKIEQTEGQKAIAALIPSTLDTSSIGVPPAKDELPFTPESDTHGDETPDHPATAPVATFDASAWCLGVLESIPNATRRKAQMELLDAIRGEQRITEDQRTELLNECRQAGWVVD